MSYIVHILLILLLQLKNLSHIIKFKFRILKNEVSLKNAAINKMVMFLCLSIAVRNSYCLPRLHEHQITF